VLAPTREATGIIGWIERKNAETVFLALLKRFTSEGRRLSHKPNAANYAPTLFAMQPDREGFRKADFNRAMQALFAQTTIGIGTYRMADRHEGDCLILKS